MSTTRLLSTEEAATLDLTSKLLARKPTEAGGKVSLGTTHKGGKFSFTGPRFVEDAGFVPIPWEYRIIEMGKDTCPTDLDVIYWWRYMDGRRSGVKVHPYMSFEERRDVILVTMKMENS
jgi:hypothetical protein